MISTTATTIRLHIDQEQALRRLSEQEDRSLSSAIREAVKYYLANKQAA